MGELDRKQRSPRAAEGERPLARRGSGDLILERVAERAPPCGLLSSWRRGVFETPKRTTPKRRTTMYLSNSDDEQAMLAADEDPVARKTVVDLLDDLFRGP